MSTFLPLVGTQEVSQRWPNVAGATLEPEALKCAAEAIGQRAVGVEIDRVAGSGLAFHAFAGDRDRGAATGNLALAFG
jgi:hypothetical protein